MKPGFPTKKLMPRKCGVTLIECLIYISALAVIFSMGLAAFYRCIENSTALRRNSDDISQALVAGELWRTDIRSATQSPQFDNATQTLRIPQNASEVAYRFSNNRIERRTTASNDWNVVLTRVEQSTMVQIPRTHVVSWSWELELKTQRHAAQLRPLFTFTAAISQP